MRAERIHIETPDAFEAESRLLALEAVVSVSIVTGTSLQVKYQAYRMAPEAIAAAIGGKLINE